MASDETTTYEPQLRVAIDAARQAGDLVREEFHRPGGPRGTKHHAEVDGEAEAVARRVLVGAFPDYAYLGEELGADGSPGASAHLWLVDPNDGTSAFMEGFRGAAVSIALLRDGRPVLGVVYAYCAPDDLGDLFAWAEGAGPLTRNGEPVNRLWPDECGPEHTVLVSHKADENPPANARAVSPMRFRAVPGIAYRLALVAAGEGDVGVSLNAPGGWDYAAGHALLLGVGADLYDAQGVPITYDQRGSSHCSGRCLGGPPSLVGDLVARDWESVFRRPEKQAEPYSLCWPTAGRAVRDPGILRRAQGCLLGQFAGDSLGELVEFRSPQSIASEYPDGVRLLADGGTWRTIAGQATDDSEMALMLARAIIAEGAHDEEAAARAYAWWHESDPFDVGNTINQAVSAAARAVRDGSPAGQAARRAANVDSQANGALMRVSPLGILGAGQPPEVVAEWAKADAALTHPHIVCRDANATFAMAVSLAIEDGSGPAEVYERTADWAERTGVEGKLLETLSAATDAAPRDYMTQSGWVLIAFQNAFYQLLHAPTLEEGVVDTVMRGGDTDTNAAIAGALLGAVYGRDSIPAQWAGRVLTCRPIAGGQGVLRPRPQAFWPVDALHLAELLLLAGRPG